MPPMKDMYGMGFDPRTSALMKFTAIYALEMHHWADAAALQPAAKATEGDASVSYWARAIGSARSGDIVSARKDVQQIESIHGTLIKKKKRNFAQAVEHDRQEAEAWINHADGKDEQAVKVLRTLAEHEEATGEEPEGIPAREMLADLLLDSKHPEQA